MTAQALALATDATPEGWVWLSSWKRPHYIRAGRSLCTAVTFASVDPLPFNLGAESPWMTEGPPARRRLRLDCGSCASSLTVEVRAR